MVEKTISDKIKLSHPEAPVYDIPTSSDYKKLAAGWLIETVGLKGYTEINRGIHKNQALVLVNYGGATGNEIFELSSMIISKVEAEFGVTLEREVNII